MKKLFALGAICLACTACDSTTTPSPSDTTSGAKQSPSKPTDAGAPDAGELEGAGEASATHPTRITVGDHGYEPTQVSATAGTPITLRFTRISTSPCGEEVVIEDHDIRKKLPLNKDVDVTFTPSRTGQLAFTCGMGMFKGAIVVKE